MIPHPAPLLPLAACLAAGTLGTSTPERATRPAPATHRNHRPPLPPAPAAPQPPFEVENLGRGAQPGLQQRLRRQQRDMVAGGAIDFSDLPPISLSLTLACNLSEKHKKRDTLSH